MHPTGVVAIVCRGAPNLKRGSLGRRNAPLYRLPEANYVAMEDGVKDAMLVRGVPISLVPGREAGQVKVQ